MTGILGESNEERSRARRTRRSHGVGPGRADLPHHHRGVGSNDTRGARHQHHRRRRRRRRGGHLRHRVRPGIRRCDSGRHSDLHLCPEGLERQRRSRRPRHRPERRPEPHRHEHALRRCPCGQHDDRGQASSSWGTSWRTMSSPSTRLTSATSATPTARSRAATRWSRSSTTSSTRRTTTAQRPRTPPATTRRRSRRTTG